ncbi:hypothetical protein, partial [Gulbenkiania mobilis]|uniref:hypothetical protein n=1 Tax=Gulbenkiania mobilis TaxID=397457 RepID=UPI001F29D425
PIGCSKLSKIRPAPLRSAEEANYTHLSIMRQAVFGKIFKDSARSVKTYTQAVVYKTFIPKAFNTASDTKGALRRFGQRSALLKMPGT